MEIGASISSRLNVFRDGFVRHLSPYMRHLLCYITRRAAGKKNVRKAMSGRYTTDKHDSCSRRDKSNRCTHSSSAMLVDPSLFSVTHPFYRSHLNLNIHAQTVLIHCSSQIITFSLFMKRENCSQRTEISTIAVHKRLIENNRGGRDPLFFLIDVLLLLQYPPIPPGPNQAYRNRFFLGGVSVLSLYISNEGNERTGHSIQHEAVDDKMSKTTLDNVP
ncbi:hypothetical protein BX666DRAFT_1571359 [Dichotomocladium elegans]|nr:hypothetical protein BX666DRAFT_1571359 [Dichotomocladium elegans]